MRSTSDGNSPRPSAPRNAFEPTFLESVQAGAEPLTASEADLAGPWKLEPVPGHPGAVGVVRAWESLAEGDAPTGVLAHEESAALYAVLLPLLGREPLFHLGVEAVPGGPLPGAYPLTSVFGEQGPQVCGWLPRYHPEAAFALHLLERLVRSPQLLAEVVFAAGAGALAQVGRYLAVRQVD